MTPKKKANQLANKFVFESVFDMTDLELIEARQTAKQCALIAVDEILNAVEGKYDEYWQEVQQEILAL